MSVTLMRQIREDRGLTPTEKLVGIIVASYHWEDAPERGCRYGTDAIAEDTGLTRRAVQKTLRSLEEKGRATVVRPTRTSISKIILTLGVANVETQVANVDTQVANVDTYKEQEEQEEQEDLETPAPAARRGEDAMIGALPPDGPEAGAPPRGVPREGTFAWCERRFENEAAKHGHPRFNRGMVRRNIKELHQRYTYEEVDWIVRTFFARHAQEIRSSRTNVATLFRHLLPQVEKEAAERIGNLRSGVDTDARNAAVQERLLASLMAAAERNRSA